jgi:hypothetical protein
MIEPMRIADKLRDWMESDLVGIPVTLAGVAVVALAIGGFFVAGPLAGLLFVTLGLGLFYLLVTRPGSRRPADNAAELRQDSPETAAGDHVHRVLVIANSGLARPELTARVERIAAERPTEIRIVAPAAPASRLRALADDVDVERRSAAARLESLLVTLRSTDVEASGHVDDEGDPRSALADGLREFGADEVLLVPGNERGWPEAARLGAELEQDGLRVTRLGAPESAG